MLDPVDMRYLRRQLSRGEVILFTGAGFSVGCSNALGERLPLASELTRLLWRVAFPSDEYESGTALGEAFEVAVRQNRRATHELLQSRLTIDASKIPEWYKPYMHGPWHRVYTLNFDNFWDSAPIVDPQARQLMVVSAIEDEPIPSNSKGEVVHLNGRLDEFPRVTLSPRQYGERATTFDKWYSLLMQDLFGHPFLFVGTELDESLLWEYMALRRRRTSRSGEHRPRSFLVTPSISAAKRALLSELNIDLVEATAEEFAVLVLDEMSAAMREGSELLIGRRTRPKSISIIEDVSVLRGREVPAGFDSTEFLRGRAPIWHDLRTTLMVERDSDRALFDRIGDLDKAVLVVTGTAGTGKTCSMMQAAARMQEEGQRVYWFSASEHSELRLHDLKERVKSVKPDYLFVDDADSFGRVSGQFISEVAASVPEMKVIAGVRANRISRAGLESRRIGAEELTIPGLTDPDIDILIEALDVANRLGFLKGKTREQQRREFQKSFDRQLLVAMLEATSGERFEDLIKRECEELESPAFEIYATASVATAVGLTTTRDEVLLAVEGDRSDAAGELRRLVDRRLLVGDDYGAIRARHRVIAEQCLAYLRDSGNLGSIIEGIVYALATKLGPEHDPNTREHRLLVKLINHETLIRWLGETMKIRPIYSSVEELLSSDHHYLLQRGAFEVERGNIADARAYLSQAKSLAQDDVYVITEWAYMLMVEACSDLEQGLASHREHADEAFSELYNAISRYGRSTPYPYHILARQGMKWVAAAGLSNGERAEYLAGILEATREGLRLHPDNSVLRTIEPEVERLYLLTGARQES